jgi:hypothetical protein
VVVGSRWWRVGVAVLILAGVTTILAVWGENKTAAFPPRGNFTLSDAESFSHYALYYAGPSVDGFPLTVVQHDPGDVDFQYGSCSAGPDTGCPAPVEIQVAPACHRNLSMYRDPYGPQPRPTRIRSVPAAFFEGGARLEIYTGRSTVVIFGAHERVLRAARSLQGLNVPIAADAALPPPAKGALEGKLRC